MTTTPLKVLLLGWDTPVAPAGVLASPAAAPNLVSALAPRTDLTLLVPYLSEPLRGSVAANITGLGNLTAEELALLEARFNVAHPETWQSPAAPYLGASEPDTTPNGGNSGDDENSHSNSHSNDFIAPAAPYVGSMAPPETAASFLTTDAPATPGFVAQSPDAAATTLLNPDAFEAISDPEAQEMEALTPPATELSSSEEATPEAEETTAQPEIALQPTAPIVRQSVLDVALESLRTESADDAGLNFRVIQYARFATRVAASQDFAVIYASDWPSWLAGMEIRQLTGKPLVLYVHTLAQDRGTAADRGWVMELERLALRRADLVLTASSALALRVLELHELPPQRVRRLSSATANDAEQLAETILAALREVAPE